MNRKYYLTGFFFILICICFSVPRAYANTYTIPSVKATNPYNNKINVSTTSAITVSFNTAITEGDNFSSIKLYDSSRNGVEINCRLKGTVLTILPVKNLKENTTYTFLIPSDSIKSSMGINMEKEYSSFFTTGKDDISPKIVTIIPANNSYETKVDSVIIIKFSEEISINQNIINEFKLTDKNKQPVEIGVERSGTDNSILEIHPRTSLKNSMEYTVVIPKGGVIDVSDAQNTFKLNYTFKFRTTDGQAPRIINSLPSNGGINVKTNSNITITFSKNIYKGVTFDNIELLKGDIKKEVRLSIKGKVLTIVPAQPLEMEKMYILNIPSGALKDIADNIQTENCHISFETVNDLTGPKVADINIENNQKYVPLGSSIEVAFNEKIKNYLDTSKVTLSYMDNSKTIQNAEYDWNINNNLLKIIPRGGLLSGKAYKLTINKYAVRDDSKAMNYLKDTIVLNFSAEVLSNVGNTTGNLANNGSAAQQGDWIYFANHALYKSKSDGTNVVKLSDDNAAVTNINVVGDWVYYCTFSWEEPDKIIKIKTDGTQKTELLVNSNSTPFSGFLGTKVIVLGDWIYYNYIGWNTEYVGVYKMRTDGSDNERIFKDRAYDVTVVDDWIYYRSIFDNNILYKIKTDGSNKTKLSEDNCQNLNVVGEWIYYVNFSDGGKVCKIKTDGTGKKVIDSTFGAYINVSGDWIYYISIGDNLYKIKTDGTQKKLIQNGKFDYINATEDCLYFNQNDNGSLFRMNKDGTRKIRYTPLFRSSWINDLGDYTYYISNNDFKMYRMNTSSKEKVKLSDDLTNYMYVLDGWIYYINNSDGGKLYRMKTNGSSKKRLNNEISENVIIADGWIYYNSMEKTVKFCKVKIDGTGRTVLSDSRASFINVKDGWIYFNKNMYTSLETSIYKMTVDGKNENKLNDEKSVFINLSDEVLYYCKNEPAESEVGIYRMSSTGGEEVKLTDYIGYYLNVSGDWIYFENFSSGGRIYRMKKDGSVIEELNDRWSLYLTVSGKWCYYIDGLDNHIYRIMIDGKGKELVD